MKPNLKHHVGCIFLSLVLFSSPNSFAQNDASAKPLSSEATTKSSAPANADKFSGEFDVELQTAENVRLESPKNLRARFAAGEHISSFSSQFFAYNFASTLLALAQQGVDYEGNPVSLAEIEKSYTDPVGVASFMMFMTGSNVASKMLRGVHAKTISPSMVPYIGMAAGFMASSLGADLMSDEDLKKCVVSHIMNARNSQNPINDDACEKSYETWAVHNKIVQYMPKLLAMTLDTAAASLITRVLTAGESRATPRNLINAPGKYLKIILRGVRLSPRAVEVVEATRLGRDAVVIAEQGFFTPTALATATFDMLNFLAPYNTIENAIDKPLNVIKLTSFNYNSWLDKNGFHHEFLYPKNVFILKNPMQAPIQNAFDVEATTLKQAHRDLLDIFKSMQSSDWMPPAEVRQCTAGKKLIDPTWLQPDNSNIYKEIYSYSPFGIIDGIIRDALLFPISLYNKKSDRELRCEVESQPIAFLKQYNQVSAAWRSALMQDFQTSFEKWSDLVSGFTDQVDATQSIGLYLAKAKYKQIHEGGPRPDLSREAIVKALLSDIAENENVPQSEDATPSAMTQETSTSPEAPQKQPPAPTHLRKIPTPEMVDYVIASFACGAKLAKDQPGAINKVSGAIATVWQYFVNDQSYVQTPLGSPLQFTPPNITTGNGNICEPRDSNIIRTVPSGSTLREALRNKLNVFNGGWFDETNQKKYPNLADYVYDHMQVQVYDSGIGVMGFNGWWANEVEKRNDPIWDIYEKDFDRFVQTKFVPILISREMHRGCIAPDLSNHGGRGHVAPFVKKDTDDLGFKNMTAKTDPSFVDKLAPQAHPTYQCQESASAYRVSNGLMQSLEIEMRNYLRGLYSLYISFHAPANRAHAREVFLNSANKLIGDFTTNQAPKDAVEPAKADLTALLHLFSAKQDFVSPVPAFEYKGQVFGALKGSLEHVLNEWASYGAYYDRLSLSSANSQPTVQKSNGHSAGGALTDVPRR